MIISALVLMGDITPLSKKLYLSSFSPFRRSPAGPKVCFPFGLGICPPTGPAQVWVDCHFGMYLYYSSPQRVSCACVLQPDEWQTGQLDLHSPPQQFSRWKYPTVPRPLAVRPTSCNLWLSASRLSPVREALQAGGEAPFTAILCYLLSAKRVLRRPILSGYSLRSVMP